MMSMKRFKSRPTGRAFFTSLRLVLWLAIGVLGAAAGGPARAQLNVDINRGFVEPLPIALPDLYGEVPEEIKLGADIMAVAAACSGRSTSRPSSKTWRACASARASATGA
jgi:hypothetical protein